MPAGLTLLILNLHTLPIAQIGHAGSSRRVRPALDSVVSLGTARGDEDEQVVEVPGDPPPRPVPARHGSGPALQR